MSTNKCRFKWLMMAAVIFGGLTVAPRASATCVNDVDCPNPVCGGQVCDYNPQPPTCKAADPSKLGADGWCLSLIHISEPTRQAEISYAVFCLKKKKRTYRKSHRHHDL